MEIFKKVWMFLLLVASLWIIYSGIVFTRSNLIHNQQPLNEDNLRELSKNTFQIVDDAPNNVNLIENIDINNLKNEFQTLPYSPNFELKNKNYQFPSTIKPIEKQDHKSPKKSIDKIVEKSVRNLPFIFLQNNSKNKLQFNDTCAQFPKYYELNYNNIYWQHFETSNSHVYIYSSYFDFRNPNKPIIRIIGMIDVLNPQSNSVHCQVWYDDSKKPYITKVYEFKMMWYKQWGNAHDGILQPYMMSCQIPSKIPTAVSLVSNPCDKPKTMLKVHYESVPEKKGFAVCVKGMDFLRDDLSIRLVEWLETLFAAGASKITVYEIETHPNISKILNYYEDLDKLDVLPITLPGDQTNLPDIVHLYLKNKMTHKRQNEVIPYNDCFYRNMNVYSYVVLLDTDEIIVPKQQQTWQDMINNMTAEDLEIKEKSSLCARNVYFFDGEDVPSCLNIGIPCYMHMFNHITRSYNYTKPGHYVKCFHNTNYVKALHNHYPFACVNNCKSYSIETEKAHMQHYRSTCVGELRKSCETNYRKYVIEDKSIWKYKNQVVEKTSKVLKDCDLI